ncbi:unnamed protein product [Meloidogyne enterolobii]|uniref:Uncharacterized protein n=3 Tax=Meloidogyne enterolobii TaxID=390850 RepID=A0A6V7X8D8_MELEN|nr:unnamed protein product [Meloidogyne enterolobii]
MALNLKDKKSLSQQILPEVDFNVTPTGITISASDRLSNPRFIPFNHPGRCRECKSTEVEIDFIVTKEGVTIFCNRVKGNQFVPFDTIYELPGHCFFKIKNKARVVNINHSTPVSTPIDHFLSQNHVEKSKEIFPLEIQVKTEEPAIEEVNEENRKRRSTSEPLIEEIPIHSPTLAQNLKDIIYPTSV